MVVNLVIRVSLDLLYISVVVLLVLILCSPYWSRERPGRASLK